MRFWLIGSGIVFSPSPAMHAAALAARDIEGSYEIRDVAATELPQLVAELRSGGVRGANVTIPHKFEMAARCDRLEGDAQVLGAVNTITVEPEGAVVGGNTDARGLELALRDQGLWPAPDSEAVVLGTGGAAAAAVLALSRASPRRITVVGRRPEASGAWRERLAGAAVPVSAVGWSEASKDAALSEVDIVVNATPAGLDDLPFSVEQLPEGCVVMDLRYRPRPVDLVAAAHALGRPGCDGLEMLLQQGMLSFTRWTGAEPPFTEARAALRAAVGE